jgi:hypothetical protein
MVKAKKKAAKKLGKTAKKAQEESDIQQVVNHYFATKGLSLEQIKEDAKKKKILYSRYVRPARDLILLAGSITKATEAVTKVAEWAQSRGLDYTIETVFKRWLELDRLKPKEVIKKPFYQGNPMVWSESKKKWFVVTPDGEWLEFADKESTIEWRMVK